MKHISYEKLYLSAIRELEKYAYYCLRCLHACGIHPQPSDFVFLTIERYNGTIAQAITYPKNAIKDGTVDNPMFFLGFKFDFDFRDLENVVYINYCEDIDELMK